jgi:predicted NBD/HSP70 family sugar kinase
VFDLLDDLRARAGAPVMGIGIASPGLIDAQGGIVRRAVNLGWQDLPLRERLAGRYADPIHLANDSHATALAELFFGRPAPSSNLIVVKIGRGIGAGIVINGDLYYGDGHGAGEIGHVVVESDGEICTCGNTGCLETVAAIPAILRRAARIADGSRGSRLDGRPAITWSDLVEAYDAGDAAVGELVQEIGRYLGVAIANLVGCFNIHNIVLSGRITAFGDPLLAAIAEEMHRRVLPSMAVETALRYAEMENDIGILGGAAMLLKHELGIQ